MIEYRMATPADAAALALLRWQYRAETGECRESQKQAFVRACRTFMEQGLSSGEWVVWVAEEEGRILSHIFLRRVRKVPRPDRLHDEIGYLANAYTRPAFRGQGVGSTVLAHLLRWAKEEDLDTLICWAATDRAAFYARAGFRAPREVLENEVRHEGQSK